LYEAAKSGFGTISFCIVALRGCSGGGGGGGGGGGSGGGCGGVGVLSPHSGGLFWSEEGAGFHLSNSLKINKVFYNCTSLFIIATWSIVYTKSERNKKQQ
jgi:hypothetical protein